MDGVFICYVAKKILRNVGSCVCETMKWQYRVQVIIEINVTKYSK